MMNTRNFWVSAFERAVKTVAQTAIATIVAANASSLFDVDTWSVVGVSALAGVLSVLTSIVGAPVGPSNSPSVTKSR